MQSWAIFELMTKTTSYTAETCYRLVATGIARVSRPWSIGDSPVSRPLQQGLSCHTIMLQLRGPSYYGSLHNRGTLRWGK